MVIHAAKIRFFRVKSEKASIFFVILQTDFGNDFASFLSVLDSEILKQCVVIKFPLPLLCNYKRETI